LESKLEETTQRETKLLKLLEDQDSARNMGFKTVEEFQKELDSSFQKSQSLQSNVHSFQENLSWLWKEMKKKAISRGIKDRPFSSEPDRQDRPQLPAQLPREDTEIILSLRNNFTNMITLFDQMKQERDNSREDLRFIKNNLNCRLKHLQNISAEHIWSYFARTLVLPSNSVLYPTPEKLWDGRNEWPLKEKVFLICSNYGKFFCLCLLKHGPSYNLLVLDPLSAGPPGKFKEQAQKYFGKLNIIKSFTVTGEKEKCLLSEADGAFALGSFLRKHLCKIPMKDHELQVWKPPLELCPHEAESGFISDFFQDLVA
jgi:hypothetical protein